MMMAAPPDPAGRGEGLYTCPSQKAVYPTRDAALEDRRRIQASRVQKRNGAAKLYVYQCDRCDQFHLSSDKRQATMRRMRQYFDGLERDAQQALAAEQLALAAEVEERRRNNRPPTS